MSQPHQPIVLTLPIQIRAIPPIMYRDQHVLIAVQDEQGNYVLGEKKMYPPGIYRLVGGGVEAGEDFQVSAQREIEEELAIRVELADLKLLATITAIITGPGHDEHNPIVFTTQLFHTQLHHQQLHAGSDLDGLITLTASELVNLAQRYAALPDQIDPNLGFSWADYAKLYGPIHQLVHDLTIPQKSSLPEVTKP